MTKRLSVVYQQLNTRITYEQPAKEAAKCDRGGHQSDAVNLFVPLVPHAQVENHSGEEPAPCHTQKETDN